MGAALGPSGDPSQVHGSQDPHPNRFVLPGSLCPEMVLSQFAPSKVKPKSHRSERPHISFLGARRSSGMESTGLKNDHFKPPPRPHCRRLQSAKSENPLDGRAELPLPGPFLPWLCCCFRVTSTKCLRLRFAPDMLGAGLQARRQGGARLRDPAHPWAQPPAYASPVGSAAVLCGPEEMRCATKHDPGRTSSFTKAHSQLTKTGRDTDLPDGWPHGAVDTNSPLE